MPSEVQASLNNSPRPNTTAKYNSFAEKPVDYMVSSIYTVNSISNLIPGNTYPTVASPRGCNSLTDNNIFFSNTYLRFYGKKAH